jgi:hypothetical protein
VGSRLVWAAGITAALAGPAFAQPGPLPAEGSAQQGSASAPDTTPDPQATQPEQPALPPAPPAPPPEPQIEYRSGPSRGNALLLVGAGAGIATGICLALAAYNDSNDADAAAKYEDYDRISSRSDRLYLGSLFAAGAGVALGAIAVVRMRGSHEGTQVSLTPKKGGAAVVLERSW